MNGVKRNENNVGPAYGNNVIIVMIERFIKLKFIVKRLFD